MEKNQKILIIALLATIFMLVMMIVAMWVTITINGMMIDFQVQLATEQLKQIQLQLELIKLLKP